MSVASNLGEMKQSLLQGKEQVCLLPAVKQWVPKLNVPQLQQKPCVCALYTLQPLVIPLGLGGQREQVQTSCHLLCCEK